MSDTTMDRGGVMAATHYLTFDPAQGEDEDGVPYGRGDWVPCGQMMPRESTTDPHLVTCKSCNRWIMAQWRGEGGTDARAVP